MEFIDDFNVALLPQFYAKKLHVRVLSAQNNVTFHGRIVSAAGRI